MSQWTIDNGELRIYPNPAGNQLRIAIGGECHSPVQVEIYSVVGQNVGTYGIRPDDNIIDISHLANGMYYLKVGNKTARFVKE